MDFSFIRFSFLHRVHSPQPFLSLSIFIRFFCFLFFSHSLLSFLSCLLFFYRTSKLFIADTHTLGAILTLCFSFFFFTRLHQSCCNLTPHVHSLIHSAFFPSSSLIALAFPLALSSFDINPTHLLKSKAIYEIVHPNHIRDYLLLQN